MHQNAAKLGTLAELGLTHQLPANENNPAFTAMASISHHRVSEDDIEDLEPELLTFDQITKDAKAPQFKLGDAVWVPEWDDDGVPVDHYEVFIVGMEVYHDKTYYMIGFFDPSDGMIDTNFETVDDEDVFAEKPILEQAQKRAQGKPKLSVVR